MTISGGIRFEYYRLNGPQLVGNKLIENPSIDYRPVYRLGANLKLAQSTFYVVLGAKDLDSQRWQKIY